jgi:hypothetical protein
VVGGRVHFIECCPLVRTERGIWGFQRLREGSHTPCNCPVELLILAPAACLEWRRAVYRFHQQHSKSPALGEIWTLKKAVVPHVTITATHPQLIGEYQGVPRPLKASDLRTPIGTALAPRQPLKLAFPTRPSAHVASK